MARDVIWKAVRVWPTETTRDAITRILFDHGSQALQDDGASIVTCFPEEAVAALVSSLAGTRVEVTPLPDIDWSERWKDLLRVHQVGSLTVAPPWLSQPGAIIIEPAMAFGTGDHATTRGVLGLMQRVVRAGDFVADLGAGSAILSIAAAKLGASRVAAIELDAEAIGNAEDNVRRNEVEPRVQVIQGDASLLLPLLAPVRVVVANIISSVLVELLPAMDAALTSDGAMILSGVLRAERAHMISVLETAGWSLTDETSEAEWWSASFHRASSRS